MNTRKILAMLGALVTGGVAIAMTAGALPVAMASLTSIWGYGISHNMSFMDN